jgi:hypothetical protein
MVGIAGCRKKGNIAKRDAMIFDISSAACMARKIAS